MIVNGKEIRIFDHPYVPAIIIIVWTLGFIMGLIIAQSMG